MLSPQMHPLTSCGVLPDTSISTSGLENWTSCVTLGLFFSSRTTPDNNINVEDQVIWRTEMSEPSTLGRGTGKGL